VSVRAQRRYGLSALALLVLAAIGFGLQGIGLPLDRDEGLFATIARGRSPAPSHIGMRSITKGVESTTCWLRYSD
jgi:hypothetical protein